MGLMIREAMDERKGIHLGNTRTSGRRLAHYYTPLPKIGRATRPCIAEKGKLLTNYTGVSTVWKRGKKFSWRRFHHFLLFSA